MASTATFTPTNVASTTPLATRVPSPSASPTHHRYRGEVAGFGDSIMLGAEPCLTPRKYIIDAVAGRSFESGVVALNAAVDTLPKRVVIGLGTNGAFTAEQFGDVMNTLANRQVYWVNIHLPYEERYSFANALNGMLARQVAKYPNAHLINWDLLADEHPEWLYDDHTHLRPETCEVYAQIIDSAVRE